MNISVRGNQTDAGAVARGGHNNAAPANFQVGSVGFGASWQDDEPSLRQMYDAACATIIRLECEKDELTAANALAEAERIEMAKMLRSERQMHAQCQNERDEAQEALRMAAQRARVQAGAYKLEDLRDNSRWSIFNAGRAQALEKFAEELGAMEI